MKTNWRIWAIAGVVAVGGLTLGTSPAKAQGFAFGFSTRSRVLRRRLSPRGTGTPRRRGPGPGLSSRSLTSSPPGRTTGATARTVVTVTEAAIGAATAAVIVADIEVATGRLPWRIPILIRIGDAVERRRQSLESNGGPVRLARDRPARPALRRFVLPTRLRRGPLDDLARHVGQAEVAAVVAVGQLLVVEAEQVQDRGVQVVDADAVVDGLVADLVGLRRSGRRP